jgi:hypothetical protein
MSEYDNAKHKETFHQAADSGIPAHWVVQFYTSGSAFPEAAYFNTFEEAVEFEGLLGEVDG